MARRRVDPQSISEEVAALGGLSLDALRERWRELFGDPAPRSLRREFLVKACAYQTQAKAFGGLSAATKRRLRAIADAARTGAAIPTATTLKLKLGTRLVRAWGGGVHTVTAIDGGFEYRGRRYWSLSAIAKAITGTSRNGRTFFGVKQCRPSTAASGVEEDPALSGSGDAPADSRSGRTPAPESPKTMPPPSAPNR